MSRLDSRSRRESRPFAFGPEAGQRTGQTKIGFVGWVERGPPSACGGPRSKTRSTHPTKYVQSISILRRHQPADAIEEWGLEQRLDPAVADGIVRQFERGQSCQVGRAGQDANARVADVA